MAAGRAESYPPSARPRFARLRRSGSREATHPSQRAHSRVVERGRSVREALSGSLKKPRLFGQPIALRPCITNCNGLIRKGFPYFTVVDSG